jgi:AcrR family transcriptional regulator
MKEQIINSVKSFIRTKGFQFTIADIVKDVRISKNTFYQHFESKEEVILHIIKEMKAESDGMQIKLLNDSSIPPYEKLKMLLVALPSDYDLINPITINQLKTSFPQIYEIVGEIYHKDWDRFSNLYQDCVDQGIVKVMDILFFKELYIIGISHLPTAQGMNKYNHKELLTKLVDQLFEGVPYTL